MPIYSWTPPRSQSPQCEGLHQDRYLFNAKVVSPAPVSYVPRYDPSFKAIVVNAGIAHGVTDGAEFAFYAAQESNPRGKPLGTYIVDKATSFYSTMKPAGGLSISALPSGLAAFQTQIGQGSALRLYDSGRVEEILRARGYDLRDIQFVDSRDKAHLELVIQESHLVITVRDAKATRHGRYQLPTMEFTWDKFGSFLYKAQSFYRELDRSSVDIYVTKDIGVEFYRLQEMPSFFEDNEPELWPSSSNLLQAGMIHLVVEEGCSYGVKLTNNGPYDLYPSLFYFDNSDPTRIRESLWSLDQYSKLIFAFNRHILSATIQWTLLPRSPFEEGRRNVDHWVWFWRDAAILLLSVREDQHCQWLPQVGCFNSPAQFLIFGWTMSLLSRCSIYRTCAQTNMGYCHHTYDSESICPPDNPTRTFRVAARNP